MLSNTDFANYKDDTTPYVVEDDAKEVIESLKNALDELFCWFAGNQMKANADKCHLVASCNNELSICVKNYNITNSKCKKLKHFQN